MKLMIKNMVCTRCKLAVQNILEQLSVEFISVELGELTIKHPLSLDKKEQFKNSLADIGLELLTDSKLHLIELIKLSCSSFLKQALFQKKLKLSDFISNETGKEYSYLSRLFSSVESVAIEQFYLTLRLEKVKELITYQQLSFSEIAYDLGFSSVAHLSRQFKKITGLTLTEFRESHDNRTRRPLDKVTKV